MGFINRNKFIIYGKTFYNDEDIIIISIIDKSLDLDNLTIKFIIIEFQICLNIDNI